MIEGFKNLAFYVLLQLIIVKTGLVSINVFGVAFTIIPR